MKAILDNLNEVVVVRGGSIDTSSASNEIHYMNDYYMKLV